MDDIVTQLRNECQCTDDCRAVNDPCISMRGADEIERLRGERDDWLNAAVAYKIGWVSRRNKIYDRLVNGMENHE